MAGSHIWKKKNPQVLQCSDVSAKQKNSPFSQPRQRSLLFGERQQASGHQAKALGIFITWGGWESLISCYILFPSLPSPGLQQAGSSSPHRIPVLLSPRLPLSNSFIPAREREGYKSFHLEDSYWTQLSQCWCFLASCCGLGDLFKRLLFPGAMEQSAVLKLWVHSTIKLCPLPC